ncbi:MAG: hypothetical protein LC733_03150, partial [Actinobacteria bacterium]|nr:hypothetical protein [Actinomycetota bacterium]
MAEGDVAGLRVSEGGFTLVPETSELDVAQPAPFRFRITGPDGAPLRSYRVEHDRELHLIVASRDLTWFSHVHPTRDPGGTWSVPLQAPRPGPYRAFADFAPTSGDKLVLGVDLSAAGEFRPLPLPAPQVRSAVGGYDVSLDGAPRAAGLATVTMGVQRGGRPVTDLQPYLGAYGHLVALRAGDLAYLHVHPEGEPGDGQTRPGPDVRFGVELPSAGDYRLFFDFQHDGTVRTADFTVSVPPGA